MKTKIKKYSKSLLAMLMSLLIILSAFPITSFASTYITDMNSDAQFGVISGSLDKYGHELHYAKYDGKTYIVFCVQYGKTSPTGLSYKYGSDFKTYVNNKGNTYDTIADYIAFGYTLQYGDGLPNTKEEWIAACCTQQYVWEKLGVNPTRSSWDSTYMSDALFTAWKKDTENLMDLYYNKKPSFNKDTKNVNLGSSTTLTDSNKVMEYYPTFSKTIDKVTFSHTKGENKLTISVADNCTTHSVSFNSASQKVYQGLPTGQNFDVDTMNYVYFDFDSGSIQNLMFSNYVDPQNFRIDVNIEFGNLKIKKTSEDEIIKNIPFTVKGNGKTYDLTTDDKGNAELKNIPVGTYQVYEGDILRYVKQAVKTVTVTDGNTATVSFKNDLKKGDIKIRKDSEDKIVKNFTFIVNGSDGSTYNATTNADGIATITDVPVYDKNNNKIVYTVQETNIPVRYVTPDNQTVTLEADKTSTVTFNNTLKKFRVKVVKSDIEKGTAQGDAKLSGAVYGIYKGNQLIDTYTTDNNASFITKYYVCDTDWTIKEISSSEGYLVNSKAESVGADPKLYKVEYNTTANNVVETPIKGRISLIKHSDDGSSKIETPEKNAEFQIYLKSSGSYAKADPDERDIIVTDEYGYGITKLLPYGTYTVHQTKGTEGTEYIADFDVFISENEKEYKYLINDPYFYSYVKIVKPDAETGKQIAYAGAGFQIYAPNGEKVTMTYTYPTPTTIDTFYTNSEGYLVTPEKLQYGKGYKLVEVQAPYGYVLDSTPINFDVTQEHSTKENALTIVKVERPNLAQKGVIEITKEGEIFSSVGVLGGGYIDENGNDVEFPITYNPIYETKNLANAVFQIYAAEDITTLDGTTRYYQGELVDEITTGKDGIAKSKELYLGKYTVIEKTAPHTFYNSNGQYDVELTYAGQNVSVTSTALSVFNERQKVAVSLTKIMEQNETFNLGMNNEILSVQFGIYANEDIKAADGFVIPKDALITYGNCDENGNFSFNCDLPIGFKWYAKEMATDENYILSNIKYEFDTNYQGQNIETINIDLNNGEPIENNLICGTIKGLKTDRETEKTIEGTLFGLFNSDETEFTEANAILTALTDKDGIFVFENVPFGNWIVKELQPAENYLPSNDIHHITVSENEQLIEIKVVNDHIPELKTTATVDGEKEICATEIFTLTDIVEYKHLIPNKEYVLKGVLMDKNTGKELIINGETVTAETVFIPTEPNGTATVEFTFDSKYIKTATDIVVFESLYKDGKELAVHADIDDEGQTVTVKVPEIKTTAKVNGKKEIVAKGEITIDDTVKYTNLTPGKEYKIVGTLMDKSTGKPFEIDGKSVTSEVVFTPEKSSGKVTVSFTFDSNAIKETTELVVFETLYRDNVEIAVHADLEDEGQTVKINMPVPEKPSTPKTGDDRNYGFWIGLGFIAIGGAVSAVILKIKAKKDEDIE
ncbi:MAG: VaFE repeat-containing surface-anchored protein [Acetobacter sp.]|nr:VaFE repeat-containing surface-anchored protein [Bacteroides sp.]MCM1340815.1 VaFE repeat-containing surface-anchored protein [Acetobacter sp.]MCM1432628.1 VaFE repeat-containing surface-anchored protein [Clostridiales bacterium]